ncbi:uncharacterized protein LOC100575919 isoform X1 [Acyrthosiphon pisum]|uniref:Uncharacterized protein n=2 Tax=Acyrthosiphon pisum TaxID=7029 RepID=A0A8R1W7F4_ACYPI|nr:uncharacterized protein LOC100575919 isoform X1 [Acyrthosiphon pisum]|eukprot:XP_003248012.1 PREDICTED: uncharacterized protein LOC100575919 isoform X1 [Acyrthosiphon pisum]
MVFKASRKIGRKLKTRVSLLLLVCLAMPAAARDNDLDFTAMPITSLTIRHCGHILIAANAKNNELYMSTKSRNPTEESINLNRSNDIKILKRVRTQLKVARNHFRNNREVIARLYSDVKTVMQTNYHYEWLPSQSLVWYKKHVKKLDKDTKVFILLPVLRDSLHNFSVTLEQMRLFSETHLISNYTIRKLMLDDLSKHLIAVLCEVEAAMISLSTWRNRKMPEEPRTVIVGGLGWDPNPDHTTMMIQDWGVLTIYYRFLKDWLHISRKMVQDQVDLHQRWSAVSAVVSDVDDGDDNDESSASTIDRLPPAMPLSSSPLSLSPLSSSPMPCIRHRRCGSSKYNKRPKTSGSVT